VILWWKWTASHTFNRVSLAISEIIFASYSYVVLALAVAFSIMFKSTHLLIGQINLLTIKARKIFQLSIDNKYTNEENKILRSFNN